MSFTRAMYGLPKYKEQFGKLRNFSAATLLGSQALKAGIQGTVPGNTDFKHSYELGSGPNNSA